MDVTQILVITGGIIAALVFIYLLTKSEENKKMVQPPSIVKGFASFFAQNDIEALEEMRRIALADKGTPEIYLAIGFLYRKQKEYLKAAQVHEVLLGNKSIDDVYKKYLTAELAKDYLLAGMSVRALTILKELPNREHNPDNLVTLARASFQVNNFDNALTYLEKYEKATGKTLRGFYAKCMIAKACASTDWSKAQKYIKQALQKDPNCRSIRFIAASLLMKENKKTKAGEEYLNILKNGLCRDDKDIKTIENNLMVIGEEEKFIKTLKNIQGKSENPFTYIALADYYLSVDEKEKACTILRGYLKDTGSNPAVVRRLADITEDKIFTNILGNRKTFYCQVCGYVSDNYKDDCPVCFSFDSIYPK